MSWSFETGQPVYLQIASRIRADILNGTYAADEQIPSVRQLAYTAAVNPNTMQRALTELEQEGLLVTRGTAGRFVTGDRAILDAAQHAAAEELIRSFLSGCRQIGLDKEEILRLLNEKEETL